MTGRMQRQHNLRLAAHIMRQIIEQNDLMVDNAVNLLKIEDTKDDQEPSHMAIYLKRDWQILSNLTDNIEDYAIEMSRK